MASDDLRARIAEALMAWAEGNNAPRYASMRRPATVVANANSRADAVMAVVQPELDRLTAELHRHAACALCGHERHRHGYEPIIRRDWCSDCPTTNDLHTFKANEETTR